MSVEERVPPPIAPLRMILEGRASPLVNQLFGFVEGRASPPVHNQAQPGSRFNLLARDESLLPCHREN
jgi:hypothetical protein